MITNLNKRKLNMPSGHRRAALRNLATNLVRHESGITTTVAKAKELRRFVDRLVTRVKRATTDANKQRAARSILTTASAADKFVRIIVPRFENVRGGYTRMARLGTRRGDNADMAVVRFR
jgi:large subunit ribosomal protein L17